MTIKEMSTLQIDLVDLELLIRALEREREFLQRAEADEPALYKILQRGELSDRFTRLRRFFREQKARHAQAGVGAALQIEVSQSGRERGIK